MLHLSIFIDFYKFILYSEPSFFLFIGKVGSFKTALFSPVFLSYLSNLLILFVSPIAMFNRLLLYTVVFNKTTFLNNTDLFFIDSFPFHTIYLYYKKIYTYFYTLRRIILQIIFSVARGWTKRLRLVGIGYKLYHSHNLLILKIGYNKCVFFLLPFDLRLSISGRKKRGFNIFGIYKLRLALISKLLLQLRIPNIYTGKGIRMRGIFFIRKFGKKSLF